MQPAGFYLGEEYHRAGGVPSVVRELMKHKRIHEDALTVNGKTMGENCRQAPAPDSDVIRTYDKPLVKDAGFIVLRGNLFDSAIMKTSVISKEFRDRYFPIRRIRKPSRAAPSYSRARRIITTASTMNCSTSTSIACCSCAASARSAIPAAPRW